MHTSHTLGFFEAEYTKNWLTSQNTKDTQTAPSKTNKITSSLIKHKKLARVHKTG